MSANPEYNNYNEQEVTPQEKQSIFLSLKKFIIDLPAEFSTTHSEQSSTTTYKIQYKTYDIASLVYSRVSRDVVVLNVKNTKGDYGSLLRLVARGNEDAEIVEFFNSSKTLLEELGKAAENKSILEKDGKRQKLQKDRNNRKSKREEARSKKLNY